MVIMGISMAILSSTLIGFAGMLPPKYMSALMLGISLNGVLVLGVRVLTLVSFDIMDPVAYFAGAILFFAVVSVFLIICAFGIFFVIKQNLIIFSLALTLDDNRDYYSETGRNRNLNKIIDANDTISFNNAVFACLQQ